MKKIIFVDDDPGIQDIAKLFFERAGYQINVLSTGKSLLKNSFELPDVFVLDKQLPDMDGLDICRRLKSKEKTKAIPVIMLSANPDIKSLAKMAGADEAVEKPFDLMIFKEIIAKYAG